MPDFFGFFWKQESHFFFSCTLVYRTNSDLFLLLRAPVLSRKKTRMPVFSLVRSSRNSRHKALRKSCTNPCRNCLHRTRGGETPENSPRPCAGFINGDCTSLPEQRGKKAGCQFATLCCNELTFNAVAPFARFKCLFIKQKEGKKKNKKAEKWKNNFYPSDTQEGCSKLQVSNKKIKQTVKMQLWVINILLIFSFFLFSIWR